MNVTVGDLNAFLGSSIPSRLRRSLRAHDRLTLAAFASHVAASVCIDASGDHPRSDRLSMAVTRIPLSQNGFEMRPGLRLRPLGVDDGCLEPFFGVRPVKGVRLGAGSGSPSTAGSSGAGGSAAGTCARTAQVLACACSASRRSGSNSARLLGRSGEHVFEVGPRFDAEAATRRSERELGGTCARTARLKSWPAAARLASDREVTQPGARAEW